MHPMRLKPVYDKTTWADDCLTVMRDMEEKRLGTCQEISAHLHAKNIILNGECAGKALDELVQTDPQFILEEKQLYQMLRFTYLGAGGDLSIQVHSYDEYTRAHEDDEGETESWYILKADRGATLVIGTTALDAVVVKAAFESDQVEDYVRKAEVGTSDFVCIDIGMLHVLGKGIFALEIRQDFNATYWFYDCHRQDADGRERELHIDKNLDIADFGLRRSKVASPFTGADATQEKLLVDRRKFSVHLMGVAGNYVLPQDGKRFYCLSNVSVGCILHYQGEELPFTFAKNIFVPAGCTDIEICGEVYTLVSFVR